MTESKRRLTLYALLVIAVIWGTFSVLQSRRVQTVDSPAAGESSLVTPVVDTAGTPPDLDARKFQPWGRDPFGKSASAATKAEPSGLHWVLSGIVYNAALPVAYINDKMVSPGDRVDQALVVRIDRNKVTLEHDGRRFDLYVTEG